MINSFFLSGSSYHILSSRCFIFSFPEFQALIITEIHLNHYKVSPCVSNFSFFSLSFCTGVLHGGSTWWFIKDLFPSRSVHQDSFLRSLSFFILQSGVQFFLQYHWRWYYVILDNLNSCFMIHMLSWMRYFKSINLVIGVILGYISPKAFPKDCCYYGAYNWPKFFICPSGE